MLPLLSDEDLQGAIVDGLLLHHPSIDLVRVKDVGLMQTADDVILEVAARQNRVILTHDRNTMTAPRAAAHGPGAAACPA
jgi:predicted nuclease of predicted toxin-antitoxin system